jgi:hypothetical protein
MIRQTASFLFLLLFLSGFSGAYARAGESQEKFQHSNQEFLQDQFDGVVPSIQRVWVRGDIKKQVEEILQHRTNYLRLKYWQNESKSVWILNEIGKEQPITVGISLSYIESETNIDEVKVLAYRESRGWEVKHDFFTKQFIGLGLKTQKSKVRLSGSIDGISGATLSVRALKKVAKIALLLEQHVRDEPK